MAMEPVTLAFDDLEPHLLLKNGNFLYKLPHGGLPGVPGEHVVCKVYFGSRGPIGRVYKSIANVLLYGQTSYLAYTRLRIERECLALWAEHGFRTFDVYDHIKVDAPQAPDGGYLMLEFVERTKLFEYMQDESVDVEERFALYRRWLADWGRRHQLAIDLKEPRLVHENGDGKHVMLMEDGGFLWFDFEMVYRSKRKVRWFVAHELIQYIWHLCRELGGPLDERLLEETVAHYPDPQRLHDAWAYFWKSPNLLMRLGRKLDRFRKRAKKPTSKYNIARRLKEKLAQAGK